MTRPATKPPTPSAQATPTATQSPTPGRGARPKDGGTGNAGSASKARRFKSVKEVTEEGSPVVRKLFAADSAGLRREEDKSEGGAVNMDRFIQRTGKVGSSLHLFYGLLALVYTLGRGVGCGGELRESEHVILVAFDTLQIFTVQV